MGSSDQPLTGFLWNQKFVGGTDGILIWSDVFLHTTSDNEKLAIIFVDTEGLFGVLV